MIKSNDVPLCKTSLLLPEGQQHIPAPSGTQKVTEMSEQGQGASSRMWGAGRIGPVEEGPQITATWNVSQHCYIFLFPFCAQNPDVCVKSSNPEMLINNLKSF